MFKDANFLKEWIEYGDSKNEEPFRFISYYIAFNFLYNACDRTRYVEPKTNSEESELNQIYNFIDTISDFDPYTYLERDSEYYLKEVTSEKPYIVKNERGEIKERYNQVSLVKIKKHNKYELFKAIYIVRCNLFHGSKSIKCMEDEEGNIRNSGLLRDGSKILKELINKKIEKLKNF